MTHRDAGTCAHVRTQARLQAYHDGELTPLQVARVEAHLAECASCRDELAALRSLTRLLQVAPAAQERLSGERFAAQVALKLRRRPERTPAQQALFTGWQLVPVFVVSAWFFIQAAMLVTTGIAVLLALGIGTDMLSGVAPAQAGTGFGWLNLLVAVAATVADLLVPGAVPLIRQAGSIMTGLAGAVGFAGVLLPLVVALSLWSWLATWVAAHRNANYELKTGN